MSGRVKPHIARKVFGCIVVMRNKTLLSKIEITNPKLTEP